MKLIECKNVSLGYDGKEILNDISFSINKGEYLCIVGENGSGKSTLLKGILGLIKPYKGSINLYSKTIGYLPQQSLMQDDFPVCAGEVVLSGCLTKHRINPFYTKKDKQTADEAMKRLEISSLKKTCYRELSGGQKQRVLLARALCAAGNLLILDEPVAGLDPIITNELYDIIEKLNKKDNITVIMISHDIRAAVKYASHILHIDNNMYFFGTTKQYLSTNDAKSFMGGCKNE
jgi:zinc transport system ATP-binding protein